MDSSSAVGSPSREIMNFPLDIVPCVEYFGSNGRIPSVTCSYIDGGDSGGGHVLSESFSVFESVVLCDK